MSRLTALRRRPLRVARVPWRDATGLNPFSGREPVQDPRGQGHHSTLPYREATQLLRCLQIMGPSAGDYCRQAVLDAPMPRPEFETAPGISSPVPFGADHLEGGGRSARIGIVTVTLEPDATTTNPAMAGRAETSIRLNNVSITWRMNSAGVVTRINGPRAPRATIRTTYGRGVSASSRSGYGRGTTAADVAAGNTSLGFHEGRHGVDYLRYFAAHPFPQFTGRVGMTGAEISAAASAYQAARAAYVADLQRVSTENTDCVGNTAGVSNEARVICNAMNGGAGP